MAATNVQMLTERVELLEKQLAAITKNDNSNSNTKNTKTSKKGSSKKDSPKKERVKTTTGYIVYSNSFRDEVKQHLTSLLTDDEVKKPKNTDIMKELARMWKDLNDDEKIVWNNKAKEQNAQYKAEAVA
tara:strand:+ start:90 stop:476 length:387 start_codon:yes stop_codon:yes gene_type:complete